MEDFNRSMETSSDDFGLAGDIDSEPQAAEVASEPDLLPLPSITEQFKVVQKLFPKRTVEDREAFSGYRRLIHKFPAIEDNVIADNLMDKTEELDLFARSDLQERMRLNRVLILTAARFLLESLDANTPGDLHYGRTIYGHFKENLQKVGMSEERSATVIAKEDLYEAWNDYIEGKNLSPVLLPDTKLAEDKVEQVLNADATGDTPQMANS